MTTKKPPRKTAKQPAKNNLQFITKEDHEKLHKLNLNSLRK